MAEAPTTPEQSAQIQTLLSGLRRRVRAYVWIEGISLAIAWLGLTFWFAYLIDYWLLVRVFAVEFPWYLRAVLLGGISLGLFFILYRWILRRAFANLSDHSMAVVLERRFGQFHDSLVTTVEMGEHPDHATPFSETMLTHTKQDAVAQVPHIRLRDVFNFVPLVVAGILAVVLAASIGSFAFATNSFPLAFRRTYLLSQEQWKRNAEIEILGIAVVRPDTVIAADQLPEMLTFDEGTVRVARGSDVVLHVQADADLVIPDKCVVRFWSDDGSRGTSEMEKLGNPKDDVQRYRLEGLPFKGVLSSFQFEVIGKNYGSLTPRKGDDPPEVSLGLWPVSNREEGFVEVVDAPIVAEATLAYTRPKYIEASGVATEAAYRRGISLPVGTAIKVRCVANKPLKFAHVYNPQFVPSAEFRGLVTSIRGTVSDSRHAEHLADYYLKLAEQLERDRSIRSLEDAHRRRTIEPPTLGGANLLDEHDLAAPIDAVIKRAMSGSHSASNKASAKKRLAATYRAIAWAILGQEDIEVTETFSIVGSGSKRKQFQFEPPRLNKDLQIEVSLHDRDDIVSDSPYRMTIFALPDEPPKVNVYLTGIGTAVTPDVQIPLEGAIKDDHGVARAWVEVRAGDLDSFEHSLSLGRSGQVASEIDFKAKRNDEEDGFALVAGDENKLFLHVLAKDHYDLGETANVGKGDLYQLDIVTADKLRIMLERLESAQRERLQQIRDEMGQAHEFLLQIGSGALDDAGIEPGDKLAPDAEPGDEQTDEAKRHSVRVSFATKALLQTRKSMQEVAGVVDTIRNIRDQLINNRVDAEDHKRRLKEEIADPLQRIIERPAEGQVAQLGSFPSLEGQVTELERRLKLMAKDLEDSQLSKDADDAAAESIEEMERLLSELDQILDKLRKIEDYNKLLNYVRELLEQQRELNERTKERYEKSALEDLLE